MSGEVAIRQMRSGDVERVLEIAASLKNTPHWSRVAYLTAIDPQARPRRVALVAVESASDEAVGFAVANIVPPVAELESIAVSSNYQRRGWAIALLKELFHEIRRAGANEVVLEVRESNEAAIRLYRRTGFVEEGRRSRYYADPIEDATVMHLTI